MILTSITKTELTAYLVNRCREAVITLNEFEYGDVVTRSIAWLNNYVFSPRDIILRNPPTRMCLAPYHIRAVSAIYYPNETGTTAYSNALLPEVGWLPLLVGQGGLTSAVQNLGQYFLLRTNINTIYRLLNRDGDFDVYTQDNEMWIEFQNLAAPLVRLRFLPQLDFRADSFDLYDHELAFLYQLLWTEANLSHCEKISGAIELGVGKEVSSLLTYWSNKRKEITDQFIAQATIISAF